jgi:hypothetical protein
LPHEIPAWAVVRLAPTVENNKPPLKADLPVLRRMAHRHSSGGYCAYPRGDSSMLLRLVGTLNRLA